MNIQHLILATSDGIYICGHHGDEWPIIEKGLPAFRVTSVITREGVILAGTTSGIFRSDDLGHSWSEAGRDLEQRHIRQLAYDPEISDREFAGTEPAGIYRSSDGGASWESCQEVITLRERHGWYLPYSPEAGCVRGIAFDGKRAYAAVEVGGVLVSEDGGQNWRLAGGSTGDPHHAPPPAIHPDVHSIYTHPASPDLVHAPTGGGFYRSSDGGYTWQKLYDSYCRAAWISPGNASQLLLGPADGVDRNGRIEESLDGGQTWQAASSGLEVPWPRAMVEQFYPTQAEILAVLSDGRVLSSPISTWSWKRLALHGLTVNALAIL